VLYSPRKKTRSYLANLARMNKNRKEKRHHILPYDFPIGKALDYGGENLI